MRLPRPHHLFLLLPAAAAVSATSWGCQTVQSGLTYDFKSLGGAHSVVSSISTPPTIQNTTWSIDPCAPLQKNKDTDAKEQCPDGTYVCGLVRHIDTAGKSFLAEVIPVAGDIDGHAVDEQVLLLNATEAGGKPRGVRVEFNGGNNFAGHEQRAVVDFVCDKDVTGEADEAITFVSYEWSESAKKQVLRLEWKTKMACVENAKGGGKGEEKKSAHWGFFTWLFIIVFLGAAAYLICVVWLGWDLRPHRDMIGEMSYLVKDFFGRVGSTLQGRSSRGGYSAV
ncbi:autophagy-related protein 27 [Tricharina praecox]|uniref:autophagy-related protein 27 n=1 Tax=Tricharina praecox TaxID=43433 RepID=UPI00221E5F15|nr:autophagy-related protein 27 [Tricharina praecox]KAI5858758.1 autophagy-related protein 27 [Tricharina praecox]